MRIVSLLPSATEIICGLGLRNCLVGVTHECDYPTSVLELPKVTKTLIPTDAASSTIDALVRDRLKTQAALYSLNMPVLESLQPDLIVTQALCDVCAVAESEVRSAACALPGDPQVVNLEPTSLIDVFACIRQVALAADRPSTADSYIAQLQRRVELVASRTETIDYRPRTLLLEWIDPPFCAGHWSPELVAIAGGREVIGKAGQQSETIDWQAITKADPELMMIACCGFDVARTLQDIPILKSLPGWESLACVKSNRVYLVDGAAYFSRPGPRLVDSLEILAHALHPQTHPLPESLKPAMQLE